MSRIFPKTASSQQVQRHYRTLFNEVLSSREPLIILNNNKPEVVIMDIESYSELQCKVEAYEQELARKALNLYQCEKQNKKLQKISSLSPNENES